MCGRQRWCHRLDLDRSLVRSNTSGLCGIGESHEGPDSKNDADEKHGHKEVQHVQESASHVGEGGVGVPERQDVAPSSIDETLVGSSLGEMRVSLGVASVDHVPGFPDEDHGKEHTNNAGRVQDRQEGLR